MPSMSATYMRDYRAQVAARAVDGGLLPFQSSFVSAVCRQERPPELAALSCPQPPPSPSPPSGFGPSSQPSQTPPGQRPRVCWAATVARTP